MVAVACSNKIAPFSLFLKALNKLPSAAIIIVKTPKSGVLDNKSNAFPNPNVSLIASFTDSL